MKHFTWKSHQDFAHPSKPKNKSIFYLPREHYEQLFTLCKPK